MSLLVLAGNSSAARSRFLRNGRGPRLRPGISNCSERPNLHAPSCNSFHEPRSVTEHRGIKPSEQWHIIAKHLSWVNSRKRQATRCMGGQEGRYVRQVWFVRVLVRANRESPEKVLEERFCASNLPTGRLGGDAILDVVRAHWRIENNCFGRLDIERRSWDRCTTTSSPLSMDSRGRGARGLLMPC
jgi:hypothetical protein